MSLRSTASAVFYKCVLVAALVGCGPAPQTSDRPAPSTEWREFQGTWTATGKRDTLALGESRRSSISHFTGSVVLTGASRPNVGFRAEAVLFNDSATGIVGRAVWTDERGEQVFSELHSEGPAQPSKFVGSFFGGTGRYIGVTGSYEFSWRFLIETEDGAVQGQSMGLHGRVHLSQAQAASDAGGSQP